MYATSIQTRGMSAVWVTLFALRNPLQKLCYLKLRWWGLSSTFKRHQARISMTTGMFYSTQICIFQLSKGRCGCEEWSPLSEKHGMPDQNTVKGGLNVPIRYRQKNLPWNFPSTSLEQLINCLIEDNWRISHLLGVDSLHASWQFSTENGMSYYGKVTSKSFI